MVVEFFRLFDIFPEDSGTTLGVKKGKKKKKSFANLTLLLSGIRMFENYPKGFRIL